MPSARATIRAQQAPQGSRQATAAASHGSAAPVSASRSRPREDADLARRIMEFDALNQTSPTKQCDKDCVHLSLGWRPGEQPTREQMEDAAHGALKRSAWRTPRRFSPPTTTSSYTHLHIVASKINPETGRAYDLKGNFLKLSKWAEEYERDHSGGIVCTPPRGSQPAPRRHRPPRRRRRARPNDRSSARPSPADLDRVLRQADQAASSSRAQFAETGLDPSPTPYACRRGRGGPTTRYTTRAVARGRGACLARRGRHWPAMTVAMAVTASPQRRS